MPFAVQYIHSLVDYTDGISAAVVLVWDSETCIGPPGRSLALRFLIRVQYSPALSWFHFRVRPPSPIWTHTFPVVHW